MNIFKCDVCGAEITREPFRNLVINRVNEMGYDIFPVGSRRVDVCNKCWEKISAMLNIKDDEENIKK